MTEVFLVVVISFLVHLAWAMSKVSRLNSHSSEGDQLAGLRLPARGRRAGFKTVRKRLQILANNFSRGQVVESEEMMTAEGGFRGRTARVMAEEVSPVMEVHYALSTNSALELDVLTRESGSAQYWVSHTGDSLADQEQAGQYLQIPAVQASLGALFTDLDCTSVVVRNGSVQAVRDGIDSDLVPSRVDRVLRELLRLAKSAEAIGTPGASAVRRGEPVPPPITVDLEGLTCPFCRDGLVAREAVSCERCKTVLHAECFGELGKCTTLGCDGRRGFPLVGGPKSKITIDLSECERCGSRTRGCTEKHCRGTRRERKRWEENRRYRARQGAARRRLRS